jgi:hypothetical protein
MATGADVLQMLRPNGGWVIYGDEFESIIYDEGVEPLTEKEFNDGFKKAEKWLTDQKAAKIAARDEILNKLGITREEAQILLS